MSNSRRVDEDALSTDGSDNESELASILQYLIQRINPLGFSRQIRILGNQRNNSVSPQGSYSNVENFHKSELCHITKKACGENKQPISKLITMRQAGALKGGRGFSQSERVALCNDRLPFRLRAVDTCDSKVFCGVYDSTGDRFVTAAQDGVLRLYDTTNGNLFKEIGQVQGRNVDWSILDVSFSPDSKHLVYSSWSSSLHMVELNGDMTSLIELPLCPNDRRFCIFSFKYSAAGTELLCGANDRHIYIYDLCTNGRTLRVDAHDEDVNTVAFADDAGQIVYSGGDDGLCKVWDRRCLNEACPKPVGVLAGHLDGIVSIDSRNDARHLISNSKDQSIKLWDIRKFSGQSAIVLTKRAVESKQWDYRWQAAPKKLIMRKTNIKGDTSLATFRGHTVLQTHIRCRFSPAFSTGQRYVVCGCAFGCVIVYDILTGSIKSRMEGHSSCVRDVSWHPYRSEIISSSWDFSVMCWDQLGADPGASSEQDGKKVADTQKPRRQSKRLAERARIANM